MSSGDAVEHAAASKSLRELCTKKSLTAQAAIDFLDSLEPSILSAVVNGANSNGKAPLHYAAQLRQGGDSAALCAALIERRADVNVATRRGYTPLLFAAGRGNSDALRALLAGGADPRVTAANGDSAASCGGAQYLDDVALDLLRKVQDAPGPWRDFRKSDDALAAQQEYEKKSLAHLCGTVSGRLGDGSAGPGAAGGDAEQVARFQTEHVIQTLVAAARADQPEQVADILVRSALTEKFALRAALHLVMTYDVQPDVNAASAALVLLRAVCEAQLSAALARRQDIKRQRGMIVRIIVGAYLVELRNSEAADTLSVEEILRAVEGDVLLAFEVFRLRAAGDFSDVEVVAVQALWPVAFDIARARSGFALELAWAIVGRQQCAGRQRQFAACRLFVLILRWVGTMQAIGADGSELIREVVHFIKSERRVRDMLDIVDDLEISDEHRDALRAALIGAAEPMVKLPASPSVPLCSDCPIFQLGSEPVWIADEPSLRGVEASLKALRQGAAELRIGLDSEWCDRSDCEHGLSIVQLAVAGHVWVVDVCAVAAAFGALLDRLLRGGSVALLGFSFGQDALRLAALLTLGGATGGVRALAQRITGCVHDLQLAAAKLEAFRGRGGPPSLKIVAEAVLGKSLDKRLQCSDWDRRPLTEAQLRYAAADAEVLLHIDEALRCQSP